MALIKKLSPDVASRIAAGEVVERPFNVVKELMENSVDAGAVSVSVDIADGGLSLIRVTDDGKGMDADDLPLALERFATSKATTVEDVYRASTFGFRGEALAAVSSVSNFTLRSGRDGKAFEIKSKFGEVGAVKPSPAVKGTMAEALNLFENVPARRKFLKNGKNLEADVVKLVKHFSLINPAVALSVCVNAKELYNASLGEDITVRASKVFAGKAFCKGAAAYSGMSVTVAATLPSASDRLKRDSIVVGVNGRLIKDTSLTQAVITAYHRLIPDGRFPAAAVDIRIDPAQMDANVHPAKMEVRFEKPRDIFCLVTDAVANAFSGRGMDIDYVGNSTSEPFQIDDIQVRETASAVALNSKDATPIVKYSEHEPFRPTATKEYGKSSVSYAFDLHEKVSDIPDFTVGLSSVAEQTKEPVSSVFESFEILGQIADSYIVAQTDTRDVLFIDQHAAHERILFEKNMVNSGNKATIILHAPHKVELSQEEYDTIQEEKSVFENFGYAFKNLGDNSLEITRVPLASVRRDFAAEFKAIAADLCVSVKSKTMDAPMALLSCKAAIKAGDKLTIQEMDFLLKLLFSTDNFGTCPHGRPIIYKMSEAELARKFLR